MKRPSKHASNWCSFIFELPAGRAEVLFSAAAIMPSAGIIPSLDLHLNRLSALASCARHADAHIEQPGENPMSLRTTLTLTTMALLLLAVALPAGDAVAQEKQHVSFKSPAEDTKYPQQQVIDVGDVPGHQVRIFEIHRTYPTNAPVIAGMKLVEQWTRGLSDLTDNNGTAVTYGVYVLENGDKFFVRSTVLDKSAGAGKLVNWVVGTITGGTGKLAGIQGVVRSTECGGAQKRTSTRTTSTDTSGILDRQMVRRKAGARRRRSSAQINRRRIGFAPNRAAAVHQMAG